MKKEEIIKCANELLLNFGEYYEPPCDGMPYFRSIKEGNEPYMRYIGDGFEIRKYWNKRNILIKYNGLICYDELKDECKDGGWKIRLKKCVLDIPKKIEAENEKENRCEKIFKEIINLMSSGKIENGDNLADITFSFELRFYKKANLSDNIRTVIDYFALGERMYSTVSLYYNVEEVYRRTSEATGDDDTFEGKIDYPIYIPGDWEKEIIMLKEQKKAKTLSLQLKRMTELCNNIKKD